MQSQYIYIYIYYIYIIIIIIIIIITIIDRLSSLVQSNLTRTKKLILKKKVKIETIKAKN